jgi:hypothetical protein
MTTTGGSDMRKLVALLIATFVVLSAGCVGKGTGLDEEKVLHALENMRTASYSENTSISMIFPNPDSNRSVEMSFFFKVDGTFNMSSELEAGNFSMILEMAGMNVTAKWPYFINGTQAFYRIKGKWYNATSEAISNDSRGSLNVDYIRGLLEKKNVTIEKLPDGYAFRVNVTFWEVVNATGKTDFVLRDMERKGIENVTTEEGWVEVHLTKEGYPLYIEEYLRAIVEIKNWKGTIPVNVTVHNTVVFRNINGEVKIESPGRLEGAPSIEEVLP